MVSPPLDTIDVVMADAHELVRLGLRRALEADLDLQVVGEASKAADLTRLIGLVMPDVAIVSTNLDVADVIELVNGLRGQYPRLGIVVLGSRTSDQLIFDCLDAGASALVCKSESAEDVVSAVRHAVASPNAFAANDLSQAMRRRSSPAGPNLSPREREVLQLLAQGLSVAQISEVLFITISTTKTHISNLYEKLNARNRAQALMAALRLDLVRAPERDL